MKHIITIALCTLLLVPSAYAQKQKVAIVAHRGYWISEQGGQSHNSIASLKAAQDLQFWGSEFDVNLTADGQLLVYHDGSVVVDGERKAFSDNPASAFKNAKLPNGENIPTLDEYLDQFSKTKTRLVFELKPHKEALERKAVELSIKALKEHGLFNPKRVIFISFSKNECLYFMELAPGFTVQYLDTDLSPKESKALGINGVDTHFSRVNPEYMAQAEECGMDVNAWTIDNPDDMKRMIELGVKYITTNQPEITRKVIKEMGLKELKPGKNF